MKDYDLTSSRLATVLVSSWRCPRLRASGRLRTGSSRAGSRSNGSERHRTSTENPFRGLADWARGTRGEGVSLTVSTRPVMWMCVRTREEEE
jgi:hypothetical protein